MEVAEYLRMARVQKTHWWFEAKRRTVAALLDRHGITTPRDDRESDAATRVLEVGPGTGSMIPVMAPHGRMFAADAYLPALRLLIEQQPAAADVVPVGADLLHLPFADRSFVLLGCFDVLYHQNVGDVSDGLAELHRVCAPRGHLVITDSAFALLRSSHDVATHGARRFRLPELTEPLAQVGFDVRHASYFHTLLFPAALAVRLTKRLLHGSPELGAAGAGGTAGDRDGAGDNVEVAARSDLAPVPGWLNAALLGLYRVETPLTVRCRMPFGSSLLILARRRR